MRSVWVVFSSFRPDESLLSAVQTATREVGNRVLIVDDGSGPGYDAVWSAIAVVGGEVLHISDNAGIAAALNLGIREALDRGADAVVTFDQDSAIPEGVVDALVSAADFASRRGVPVAFVVPEYFAGTRQVSSTEDEVQFVRHAIQSGMLIPRATFESVGLLRDDFFIDLVDTEFELRCDGAGLRGIAAPTWELGHRLGRAYRRELFGRRLRLPGVPDVVTLSTPFRYYYRVRNRRVVNREFLRAAPAWVLRDTILEAAHFVNALVLARPKLVLWRVMRTGWSDAGHARMGKMPDSLARAATVVRWSAPELED